MGDGAKQRKVKLVDMEMQDIELVGVAADTVQHQHMIGDGVTHLGIEA